MLSCATRWALPPHMPPLCRDTKVTSEHGAFPRRQSKDVRFVMMNHAEASLKGKHVQAAVSMSYGANSRQPCCAELWSPLCRKLRGETTPCKRAPICEVDLIQPADPHPMAVLQRQHLTPVPAAQEQRI